MQWKEGVRRNYDAAIHQFLSWALRRRVTWTTDTELDHYVALYLDKMFFLGKGLEVTSCPLASLPYFMPDLRRSMPVCRGPWQS